MSNSIDIDAATQRAAFWDATWDLLIRLYRDLRTGKFDGDPVARAEAERLFVEVESFYGSLVA